MKAVVMEVNERKLIVLTNDGRFLEVDKKRENIDVGEEISFTEKKNYNYRTNITKFVAAAAAFILIMTSGYGVYGYYNPFGYVNVDINPSVEIAYNLYDRVIKVEGINEDGKNIIKEIDQYRNKRIDDVVNKVIDQATESGYMDDEESAVLITLTDEKNDINDDKLLGAVNEHIENKLEENKKVEITILSNSEQNYKASKKDQISPGKNIIIDRAIKKDNSMTKEELSTKSVKEIMNIINDKDNRDKESKGNNGNSKKEKINPKNNIKNKDNIKLDKKNDKNKNNKENISEELNKNSNSNTKIKNNKNKSVRPQDKNSSEVNDDIQNKSKNEKDKKDKDKNNQKNNNGKNKNYN